MCINDDIVRKIRYTPTTPASTATPICEPKYNGMSVNCVAATPSPRSLIDEVAEHEAFFTLVRTIERARVRKKTLIEVIDDTNALMIGHLPFGADFVPAELQLSKSAQEHLKWLLANLDQTNLVLHTALNHLRTLYGNAYEYRE
jgi:hypothetical protein